MSKICPLSWLTPAGKDFECQEKACAWFYEPDRICGIAALGPIAVELGATEIELTKLQDVISDIQFTVRM